VCLFSSVNHGTGRLEHISVSDYETSESLILVIGAHTRMLRATIADGSRRAQGVARDRQNNSPDAIPP
jgi:hypothetical protein